MVCAHCIQGNCNKCLDVARAVFGMELLCECKKSTHNGEPITQQIADPTTGTVHAPGLTVDIDGKVTRR